MEPCKQIKLIRFHPIGYIRETISRSWSSPAPAAWCWNRPAALGAPPEVTGRNGLDGIPTRRQQRHTYNRDCSTHELSSVRHRRILSGQARYYCRLCKSVIRRKQCKQPGHETKEALIKSGLP